MKFTRHTGNPAPDDDTQGRKQHHEREKLERGDPSPREDLALVSIIHTGAPVSRMHTVLFFVLSATILFAYLLMNYSFFPGYPVMMKGAENNGSTPSITHPFA